MIHSYNSNRIKGLRKYGRTMLKMWRNWIYESLWGNGGTLLIPILVAGFCSFRQSVFTTLPCSSVFYRSTFAAHNHSFGLRLHQAASYAPFILMRRQILGPARTPSRWSVAGGGGVMETPWGNLKGYFQTKTLFRPKDTGRYKNLILNRNI